MNIEEFAMFYCLKTIRDEYKEQIIPAKWGQIFDYGQEQFGIVLEDTSSGPSRSRLLLTRRKLALRAGFRLAQQGDCEAVLLFNPSDHGQAEVAIRLVGARKKRNVQVSPKSLQNLRKTSTQKPLQAVEIASPSQVAS